MEAIGFTYRRDQWVRQFTIPGMHFRLMDAFGQFLVGMALHDRTVKLLELGGKKDEELVSEMPLGQRG